MQRQQQAHDIQPKRVLDIVRRLDEGLFRNAATKVSYSCPLFFLCYPASEVCILSVNLVVSQCRNSINNCVLVIYVLFVGGGGRKRCLFLFCINARRILVHH